VSSGFVDNLLITPSGDIALVECKLWRNPEARREVVAQIIDYAKDISSWTYEMLQEAINKTKPPKQKLYDLVSPNGDIDEASFHDSVSRNLRRGRFLLLIVGDGIREGMESMAEFLQQYAGFHFTLALVELALFEVPNGGYIAQPRVIAKTVLVERGIVTIEEGLIAVKPPKVEQLATYGSAGRTSITQERYFETLEKNLPGISERLNVFLNSLSKYHVTPEFGVDSLILRWRPDDTSSWNLGTINSAGSVYMDYLAQKARDTGLNDACNEYFKRLVQIVPNAIVGKSSGGTAWSISFNGKSLTIDTLLANDERRDGWLSAIAEFQKAVQAPS